MILEGGEELEISDCQKSIIILNEGLSKGGHSYLAMKFQEFSRTFQGAFREIFREPHRPSMLPRHFIIGLYKQYDIF